MPRSRVYLSVVLLCAFIGERQPVETAKINATSSASVSSLLSTLLLPPANITPPVTAAPQEPVIDGALLLNADSSLVNETANASSYYPVLDASRIIYGEQPFVNTKSGPIFGLREEHIGKIVDSFLGIPYAEPPVGKLRLRKPVPIKPWKEPLNATKFGNQCRQKPDEWPNVPGKRNVCSEDCLFLNLWVPQIEQSKDKDSRPLAVMVWIHGGDFILGSSDWEYYNGGFLAAIGEVIVVSLNYRLGRLGFLDGKSESAPGNQGLMDQTLALIWVQDNIQLFGGDPKRVTLFGQDAGAASIGLHIMSPMSSGLFRRAILQSGSAYWKLRSSSLWTGHATLGAKGTKRVTECGARLAKEDDLLDYDTSDPVDVDDGSYRGLDYGEISARGFEDIHHLYGPTYDNEFLPLNPHMSATMGLFNEVEVLIGVNENEGAWEYMRYRKWNNFTDSEQYKSLNLLSYIKKFFEEFRFKRLIGQEAMEGIYYYFASHLRGEDLQYNRKFLFDFIGSYLYVCPTTYFAEALGDRNVTTYYYRFTHVPSFSQWPIWAGATHFDEVPFVFGRPLRYPAQFTGIEKELSVAIMDAWSSFAKYGDPVTPSNQKWPKFSSKDPKYLELSTKGFLTKSKPGEESCSFWRTFQNFDVWKHANTM